MLKTICAMPARSRRVNENQLAQIAAAMNPAHQDDFFVSVRGAQVATIVRTFQIAESIEQDRVPFRRRGLRIPSSCELASAPRAAFFGFQIF